MESRVSSPHVNIMADTDSDTSTDDISVINSKPTDQVGNLMQTTGDLRRDHQVSLTDRGGDLSNG